MGGKNQTTTSTQSYTPTGLSNLQDIWSRLQGAASQSYTPYTGQQVAGLDPTQQAGIQNVNSAVGTAQPYFDEAAQYARQGAASIDPSQIQKYMSPYTQNVIDATQRNFNEGNAQQQQQVLGNAALQGALGGSRVGVTQAELARQQKLAQDPVIASLQNQGYSQALGAAQQDRAAQAQGAYTFGALAPAVQNTGIAGGNAQIAAGSVPQQNQQQQLTAQYQNYLQQQAFPYQQAQFLASYGVPTATAMGGSNYGQQTAPGANPWSQAIGLGTAAISAFSDRRVKDDVKKIGKTFDGQPIYSYKYKGSPKTEIGLMAQDVEKSTPEAVGSINGIKTVNYAEATKGAAKKGHFANGGVVDLLDVPSYIPRGSAPNASPPQMQQMQPAKGAGSSNPFSSLTADSMRGAFDGASSLYNQFRLGDDGLGNWNDYSWTGGTPLEGGAPIGMGGIGSRASGGRVDAHSPFIEGYDIGGSVPGLSFADRTAPVEEAISGGMFDPRGMNYTPFTQAPEFTAPKIAGYVPLPQARPAGAEIQPSPTVSAPVALPPQIKNPDGQLDEQADEAMAYSGQRPPAGIAAPEATAKPESNLGGFNPLGLSDDARMAIIAAGLGTAASKSPFALSAIGEGGLQGIKTYTEAKKTAADQAATKQRIDLEAQRLAQSASQFATTSGETKRYHDILDQQRKDALDERRTRAGYTRNPDGTMSPIKGGPADPEQLAIVAKAKATGAALPDETADHLAERVLAGDSKALIGLGRGAQGAENISKIQTLVAKKSAERGISPQDMLAKVAEQSGLTAQQRTFGTQVARMAVNSTEAQGAIELGREASKLVPRGNWVPITKAIQAFQTGTSDPNLAKFGAANLAIINTYSRAISPTGVPTVHDKEHAERLLSTATGPEAYNAVLDQMNKEIEIAHAAPLKAKQEMENIRKSGQAGHAPAAAGAPEVKFTGRTATGPNGKKLRETADGKWVP